MSDATKRPTDIAREFIAGITEGSPEDDARIWFENAPPEVRLVAFIKMGAKVSARTQCECGCGAPIVVRKSGKHWEGKGVVDVVVNDHCEATVKWEWLMQAVKDAQP